MGSLHLEERGASLFPLYLYETPGKAQREMFAGAESSGGRLPNLGERARAYLHEVGFSASDIEEGAAALFYHALAVLHSPAYRAENAGALRQDWPRVPLPPTREALLASAALGHQVAALLDVETPVPGVTAGAPLPEVRGVAELAHTGQGAPDFRVTVNWGYAGKGGAVMPGRGKITDHGDSVDVYLNEATYWANIPAATWGYTLGGYAVLKKWLSYRETAVLGRPLRPEEALEFMHIARRITALLALNPALDGNYRG